jgi:hypothetical protein
MGRMAMRLRFFGAAGLALLAWTSIAAALPFVIPSGRAIAVVGPAAQSLQAVVDAGGLVLSADRLIVLARSDDPQFIRRLYAAGALLVLDAEDAGGCSGRQASVRRTAGATAL